MKSPIPFGSTQIKIIDSMMNSHFSITSFVVISEFLKSILLIVRSRNQFHLPFKHQLFISLLGSHSGSVGTPALSRGQPLVRASIMAPTMALQVKRNSSVFPTDRGSTGLLNRLS